jgi:hypothetical protein
LLQDHVIKAVLDVVHLPHNDTDRFYQSMAKVSPVSMFLAATTLLVSTGIPNAVQAAL